MPCYYGASEDKIRSTILAQSSEPSNDENMTQRAMKTELTDGHVLPLKTDLSAIRNEFPIYSKHVAPPLSYLDTGASSLKPTRVIDRLSRYLSFEHANIHRGAYRLSAESTRMYEEAREKVARYLNVKDPTSVLFTRGTTESINLVAHSIENYFKPGDHILLSMLEHHSNIVPWQLLAERKKLKIDFIDINDDASLKLEDLETKIKTLKPKLVAITRLSNAFGSIIPIDRVIELSKQVGALVLVDAAQAAVHERLDLDALGADFVAFSGHKLYGPTGIGILYVAKKAYDIMEPFMGGGDMISSVTVNGSTWAEVPQKFEAGTPAIGEAIALGEAVDFISEYDATVLKEHEEKLFNYAYENLKAAPGVTVYGPVTTGGAHSSAIAFNIDTVHAHDFATIADSFNVQFRGGHHCAMPALRRLGLQSTARISFGIYSVSADIDALMMAIREAQRIFK